ncbi:MAG TPA: Rieske 2Fe-2S domain-containing protein [Gaiellaceae bacterium]|nr:Rieske 2Fe-2S domain-containing protein [Gaiellaceae bacterium]
MSFVRRVGRWATAGVVLLLARGRPRPPAEVARILPLHRAGDRAELAVASLLLLAAAGGAGFVAVYLLGADTQLLGLSLGLALAFLAAALVLGSRALVPQVEEVEERGELVHAREEAAVTQLVEESGEGITRRRLLTAAAGTAGLALGAALVVPAASLGPVLGTDRLLRTPWQRGRRLVDARGRPLAADAIAEGIFEIAFPEGAPKDTLDSPLVVIRLPEEALRLPDERSGWAPGGLLAFSQICTHAGCAITLYRWPLFEPTAPGPALVCPCHYSTFDPATGGDVLFGPAGRPLPQLPLEIDGSGALRAAGPLSGATGPSWWGVRA